MNSDKEIETLANEEQIFWFAQQFILEVENGGLYQFLYNFSGDYFEETQNSLLEIGALEINQVLEEVKKLFQTSNISKDTNKRRSYLEKIKPSLLQKLDEKVYSLNDDFDGLLLNYIKKHMRTSVLPFFMEEAIEKANHEFRAKNYEVVDQLLSPFESEVDKITLTKLKLARKKSTIS